MGPGYTTKTPIILRKVNLNHWMSSISLLGYCIPWNTYIFHYFCSFFYFWLYHWLITWGHGYLESRLLQNSTQDGIHYMHNLRFVLIYFYEIKTVMLAFSAALQYVLLRQAGMLELFLWRWYLQSWIISWLSRRTISRCKCILLRGSERLFLFVGGIRLGKIYCCGKGLSQQPTWVFLLLKIFLSRWF